MKLGVVSSALLGHEFEAGLDLLAKLGVQAIEPGCGGYHENLRYCDPAALCRSRARRERWLHAIQSRGLEISALALHGAPLSPDRTVAQRYANEFRWACELAAAVGVSRITLFAGLPEGAPGDRVPTFVTGAWPPANADVLRYQWEERVIPHWLEHGPIAAGHGVRLCFEMHPYDVVHNPRALLRLRAAVGDVIGCNFDPSHLFWQGIDPLEALTALSDAIYHVHAKDTEIAERNSRLNGVLDTTPFEDVGGRSWSFRTVGFGHDALWWRRFVTALRVLGYDDVLSIEHEDLVLDLTEGLEKAVEFLRPLMIERPVTTNSWELSART